MAIFLISYAIQDDKGSIQRTLIPVPRGALTLANIQNASDVFVAALDNLTEGKVVAADLRIGLTLTGAVGLKAAPVANSDVEEGANMSYACTGTDYAFGIRVPAFVQGLFSGKDVNDTDAAVTAFNALMVVGTLDGGTAIEPSDRYENTIASFIKGTKSFRK